jgi:hypothetical protein
MASDTEAVENSDTWGMAPADVKPWLLALWREIGGAPARKKAAVQRVTIPLRCPDGIEPQVWADWLALRARKRADVTATVVLGAKREAALAGMSLNDFLKVWCLRGTQGLQAAWLTPSQRGASSTPPETGYARSMREKYETVAPRVAAKRPGTQNVIDMEAEDAPARRLG